MKQQNESEVKTSIDEVVKVCRAHFNKHLLGRSSRDAGEILKQELLKCPYVEKVWVDKDNPSQVNYTIGIPLLSIEFVVDKGDTHELPPV